MSEISTTNRVGRPLKFQSVEDMQDKIDAYFAECDPHWINQEYWDYPELPAREELEAQPNGGALKRRHQPLLDYGAEMILKTRKILTEQKPYLITGLALALGTYRDVLLDYESGLHDDPDKSELDNAQFSNTIKNAKLRCQNFTEAHLYGEKQATGSIFSLKNNYGWVDKTEQDVTSKGQSIKSDPVDKSDLDLVLATLKKASGEAADAATE